jgi:hypothetical protein
MTYRLSARQSAWLNDKSTIGDQRKSFLAKGPAEVGTFFNKSGDRQFFRPMLRGVIVDEVEFDDAKAALAVAEAARVKFAAEAADITLDEIALGIDDRNRSVMEMCEQATLAVGRILHLGAVLADPEVYREEIEDLLNDLRDADPQDPIWKGIPCDVMPAASTTDRDDGDDESMSWDDEMDVLTDRLRRKGLFGFIVQIRTPVPTSFSDSGFGYSWGCSRHTLIYGETFEDAVKQGAAWAESYRADMRAKDAAKKQGGR